MKTKIILMSILSMIGMTSLFPQSLTANPGVLDSTYSWKGNASNSSWDYYSKTIVVSRNTNNNPLTVEFKNWNGVSWVNLSHGPVKENGRVS